MSECTCGQIHSFSADNPGHRVDCPTRPDADDYRARMRYLLGDGVDNSHIRQALTRVLSAPVSARPGVPVVRIWARETDDAAAGPEANLWAGSPGDVADMLVPVVRCLIEMFR